MIVKGIEKSRLFKTYGMVVFTINFLSLATLLIFPDSSYYDMGVFALWVTHSISLGLTVGFFVGTRKQSYLWGLIILSIIMGALWSVTSLEGEPEAIEWLSYGVLWLAFILYLLAFALIIFVLIVGLAFLSTRKP